MKLQTKKRSFEQYLKLGFEYREGLFKVCQRKHNNMGKIKTKFDYSILIEDYDQILTKF